MDRPTRLITAAFCVAFLGIALTVPVAAEGETAGRVIGFGVPVLAVGLAYGLSPRGYTVSPDGGLRVRRRWFGGKDFRVESAQTVSAVFGLGGIRLLGSGGVFGWYGLFWRKDTGRYRAYVTNRSRLVACHGPDGLVVISPADPDSFLQLLPVTP